MLKSKSTQTTSSIQSNAKSENSEKLTQKAYLNAVTAMLTLAIQTGTSLLVSPFLVERLGSIYYGILKILQQTITLMTAADGRPTQALKWTIANQQSTTSHSAKRQDIGSAMTVWLYFTPVLFTVGGILVWLSPLITKVSTEQYLIVRLTTALFAINTILIGIATIPEAVLRGMNLGYKRIMLVPSLIVLNAILTVGAILLGLGLPGIAAATVVTTIITGIVWWGIIRRLLPWFGIAKPQPGGLRRFIGFNSWFFLWTLINKVIMSGDVVVLGMVASPVEVTTYSLTSRVALMVVELSALILGSITPGLGKFVGGKLYAEARKIRHEMLSTNWLLCASIGVSILLWNQSFVRLWVGKEHYAGSLANLMIILTVVQITFFRNDAFIIDLTLNLRRKVLLGGLSAFLSLALAAILIPSLGIVGLCIGLLLGRSILSIGYPLLIGSAFNLPSRIQLKGVARPAVAMMILFAASFYLGQYLLVKNWFQFFVYGSLSFVPTFGIAFMVGLSKSERRAIIARLGKIRLFDRA